MRADYDRDGERMSVTLTRGKWYWVRAILRDEAARDRRDGFSVWAHDADDIADVIEKELDR